MSPEIFKILQDSIRVSMKAKIYQTNEEDFECME
jgi:hypothetical protein